MTPNDYTDLPQRLRDEVPGFDRVFDEHVRDNGEVLNHLLFGDLVRFLAEEVGARGVASPAVQGTLLLLERAIDSPDPKVPELIVVSFFENLEPDDPAVLQLLQQFGPRLGEEYQKYRTVLDAR